MTSIYDVLKASKGVYVEDTFAQLWGRKLSGDYTIITYIGTLPATLTGTKDGYLHRYKVYGNVGENLLEIEPEMLNEANWTLSPAATATYFMYYQLGAATAERLKKIGTIAGTVYLVAGGTYYNGEVLAITSEMKSNNLTTKERLLQNNGTPLQYTADVSEYNDIYLCIGYGPGITSSNKQTLINALFDNFDIMLTAGSTVPSTYIPYKECGERTENLFDIDRQRSDLFVLDTTKYVYGARADKPAPEPQYISQLVYNNDSFTVLSNGGAGIGFLVEVKPNTTYTLSYQCDVDVPSDRTSAAVNLITADGTFGTFWGIYGNDRVSTFTTGADTRYVYPVFRAIGYTATFSNITIIEGSTAPSAYIPYGYKLPLQSGSTPVDIYIGDDTLSDSEYVDSGTGKIYRMVSGVLTPVDPPVPFPSIPTSADSTTISWAGEGLMPSQVELEYERRK